MNFNNCVLTVVLDPILKADFWSVELEPGNVTVRVSGEGGDSTLSDLLAQVIQQVRKVANHPNIKGD